MLKDVWKLAPHIQQVFCRHCVLYTHYTFTFLLLAACIIIFLSSVKSII